MKTKKNLICFNNVCFFLVKERFPSCLRRPINEVINLCSYAFPYSPCTVNIVKEIIIISRIEHREEI